MNNIGNQTQEVQEAAYNQIMRLTRLVPERMKGRTQTKQTQIIEKIKGIIGQNSELKDNPDIIKGIFTFTEESRTQEEVRQFRRELSVHHCMKNGMLKIAKDTLIPDSEKKAIIDQCKRDDIVQIVDGTLSISKEKFKNYPSEEFWNLIKEEEVKKLSIYKKEEDSIFYESLVTKKLIKIKPSAIDFEDEYTLEFETGTIKECKAKLLLCGEFFERALNSGMKETRAKTISFEDSTQEDVTLHGFLGILGMVETGELDPAIDEEEFQEAVQYSMFDVEDLPRNQSVPEGVYGQAIWEKYWGKIDKVPPLPKEAFQPCPVNNKEKKADGLRMIDTHVFTWMAPKVDGKCLTVDSIEKMATSEKFGNNTLKYDYTYTLIRKNAEVNKSLEQGYWFAMLKSPLEETRHMNYDAQKQYLEMNFSREYDFPTTREALLYCLMPRACSGALVLGRDPVTYTRCKEVVDLHVCVGGASAPAGILLDLNDGAFSHVCVVPVRKFF